MAIAAKRLLWFGLAIANAPTFLTLPSQAQSLIPDGTLGAASSRLGSETRDGGVIDLIEGGAARGSNLFHSFEAFGVGAGQRVYFANPSGIEQIFSRVTGNSISQIDGTLGVLGAADLFVLNPNGIVFGPGARLDVAGSFTASTAGSVLFTDGSEFAAVPAVGDELLSISVPVGLQLNAQPQGNIATDGRLEVGENLTLLGNQLDLSGQLISGEDLVLIGEGEIQAEAGFESGGDLRFLSASREPGAVVLGNLVAERSPRMVAGGDVQFGDYTGTALKVEAGGSIEAGNIRTTGPDVSLVVDGSGSDEDLLASGRAAILRAGVGAGVGSPLSSITVGSVNTSNLEGGDGGAIVLVANGGIETTDHFEFVGPSSEILPAAISSFSSSDIGASGNGGRIHIFSKYGNISSGFPLISSSFSNRENAGSGGNISIRSENGNISNLTLIAGAFSNDGNAGNGGDISISSISGDIMSNIDSSSISTYKGFTRNGGDISISSVSGDIVLNSIEVASFSYSKNSGNGGNIVISSIDGNILISSIASGSGSYSGDTSNAGDIKINSISGDINIESIRADSVSRSNSRPSDSGNGGEVSISSVSGKIITDFIDSVTGSISGNSGDGGGISISSVSGDIITNFLRSSSESEAGSSGYGGSIHVSSNLGSIITGEFISSSSLANSGISRSGGEISLASKNSFINGNNTKIITLSIVRNTGISDRGGGVFLEGNNISDLEIITISSSSQSGAIRIVSNKDELMLQNLDFIASGEAEIPNFFNPTERIILDLNKLGQSGDISIESKGNIDFDEVILQSNANGMNSAGNINILSPATVTFSNSQINSNTNPTSVAKAGNIIINTARVKIENGSLFLAETLGRGNGGNIIINATESVALGQGVEDFSPVISVEASGAGRSGNIEINTPNFRLAETARITATSQATATNPDSGGSVTLNADRIDLAGTVEILAETEGQSPGGILTLQPYQTNPDLDINLFQNSRISASTSGSGLGGTLRLSAPANLSISGPGIITAETTGPGQGGNIDIDTGLLSLDQGQLFVRSTGSGNSGSININTQQATLLRNNSTIETDAGGNLGNGGNIDITTPFLISLPNDNNDIIANAIGGNGGQINITANNIFNFDIQDGLSQGLLRNNTTNDISASSETGTSGTINLNTPNLEPAESLSELPSDLIDASSLIGNALCAAGNKSEFLVTGRGGLPTAPTDTLNATAPWEDWDMSELSSTTSPIQAASRRSSSGLSQIAPSRSPLVEAKNWHRTANNTIVLSAAATNLHQTATTTCRQLQQQLSSSDPPH